MERVVPLAGALICGVAAVFWIRAARSRRQLADRLATEGAESDLWRLADADYRRDIEAAIIAVFTGALLGFFGVVGISFWPGVLSGLLAIPSIRTIAQRNRINEVSRIAADRFEIEKRAKEVTQQANLAPYHWAARLAPNSLPELKGFEIGQEYNPGAGALAGDFFDVFRIDNDRVAAVIGDVTGHGIEPSITALQAKYLLRTFLMQYRDPGQAVEQLNSQMSVLERGEEFISLCVLVFDIEAESLRYASAGHPAAFVWHHQEVRPLGATGPLLMLDPRAVYHSREVQWNSEDVAVLYTDGLAEARRDGVLFGEDGVASIIRRDPTAGVDVLAKSLMEAARDFSDGPITDDVAILVIRHA
ncbi:MAG: PP2C family protein-serine/threonine phosphatase [Acidimicrobiales bacterium]